MLSQDEEGTFNFPNFLGAKPNNCDKEESSLLSLSLSLKFYLSLPRETDKTFWKRGEIHTHKMKKTVTYKDHTEISDLNIAPRMKKGFLFLLPLARRVLDSRKGGFPF